MRRAVVVVGMLGALLVGCGQRGTEPPTPHRGPSTRASTTVRLRPTAIPRRLAAALRGRGFEVRDPASWHVRTTAAQALKASTDFRPAGVARELHRAMVTSPGFVDPSMHPGRSHRKFDRTPAWLVVYRGHVDGHPSIQVVIVDARSGGTQAVLGFGGGYSGGAPCHRGRCITE